MLQIKRCSNREAEWLNRLNDWSVECLIGWLIDWLVDLIDWLIGWLIQWSIDWLIDWLVDGLIGWTIEWLSDWLVDWLIGWLIDWSIDGMIDCFVDWWIEWLIDDLRRTKKPYKNWRFLVYSLKQTFKYWVFAERRWKNKITTYKALKIMAFSLTIRVFEQNNSARKLQKLILPETCAKKLKKQEKQPPRGPPKDPRDQKWPPPKQKKHIKPVDLCYFRRKSIKISTFSREALQKKTMLENSRENDLRFLQHI